MKNWNLHKSLGVILFVGILVVVGLFATLRPIKQTKPLPEPAKLQEPLQPASSEIASQPVTNCKLEAQASLNAIIRELNKHPEWKMGATDEYIVYSLPDCIGSWYEVNEIRNGLRYIGRIYKQGVSNKKKGVVSYMYSAYIHGYKPELIEPLFAEFGVEDKPTVIY